MSGAETPVRMMDYLSAGQVIELGQSGRVTIGYFASCSQETVTGGRLDLARAGAELAPGGVYRARNGSAEIVFRVDALAAAEGVGLLGRLVRL